MSCHPLVIRDYILLQFPGRSLSHDNTGAHSRVGAIKQVPSPLFRVSRPAPNLLQASYKPETRGSFSTVPKLGLPASRPYTLVIWCPASVFLVPQAGTSVRDGGTSKDTQTKPLCKGGKRMGRQPQGSSGLVLGSAFSSANLGEFKGRSIKRSNN